MYIHIDIQSASIRARTGRGWWCRWAWSKSWPWWSSSQSQSSPCLYMYIYSSHTVSPQNILSSILPSATQSFYSPKPPKCKEFDRLITDLFPDHCVCIKGPSSHLNSLHLKVLILFTCDRTSTVKHVWQVLEPWKSEGLKGRRGSFFPRIGQEKKCLSILTHIYHMHFISLYILKEQKNRGLVNYLNISL